MNLRDVFGQADADGMFISCTNLRTIDVLAQLEAELNVPVISSNLATCWGCLQALGHHDPIDGYGSLLSGAPRCIKERSDVQDR